MSDRRVAVVIGASGGIGRASAITLAKEGYSIVAGYHESREGVEETLAEVRKYSDGIAVQADVSNRKKVISMVGYVEQEYTNIDCLINCVGHIFRPEMWNVIEDEQWDESYKVNAKGVFNCIISYRRLFNPKTVGRIVNIASTVGERGAPGVIAYSAAKAAVINMTKSFAKAFAPDILVNCISPGNIDTSMTRLADPTFLERVIAATPLHRLGTPQEVADVVAFLCSEKASFIVGQNIDVDGGYIQI